MNQNKIGPRAFTLLEILVAASLLGIVLATVGPTFRKSSISTKGAALTLAAALSEARQQAITRQIPVALVIPSDNGSQGQADSYYIASGEQPRVTHVKWFGGEQPDLRFMVGHWPLDTSKLQDSTLTTTVTPPPETTFESDLNVSLWNLAEPKDFAFIFTPRGKLLTNGLPHFDGAYHILVSQGGSSTAAAAPGASGLPVETSPTLFSPTRVGSPYTVTISPSGSVNITPGVVGALDGASYITEQAQSATAAPVRPTQAPPATAAPVVTSVEILPKPTDLNLPPGVDAMVAPDRHLTITVRASSPERVPLFCQWTNVGGGGLSSPEPVGMTYLPDSKEWESVWQWLPPTDAEPGDQITIQGKVSDKYGNQTPVALSSTTVDPVVQVGDPSVRVLFQLAAPSTPSLHRMNIDGTGLTKLTEGPTAHYQASWSPDGNRVAFVISSGNGRHEIWSVNADGTGLSNLTKHPQYDGKPLWSPRGGQILFESTRNGNYELYLMNADGSNQVQLTSSPEKKVSACWSPDGTQIAFAAQGTTTGEIYLFEIADSTVTQLTFDGFRKNYVDWSPDGNTISFTSYPSFNQAGGDIYVIAPDGTGLRKLSTTAEAQYAPVWSPDSTKLTYTSRTGEVKVMDADGSNLTNVSNHTAWDDVFSWLPDSSRLVFNSYRNGNNDLYLVNTDGSDLEQLTKTTTSEYVPRVR
jgi:prepilin-type N-terminal cleavage/methylation domain-containing protein